MCHISQSDSKVQIPGVFFWGYVRNCRLRPKLGLQPQFLVKQYVILKIDHHCILGKKNKNKMPHVNFLKIPYNSISLLNIIVFHDKSTINPLVIFGRSGEKYFIHAFRALKLLKDKHMKLLLKSSLGYLSCLENIQSNNF